MPTINLVTELPGPKSQAIVARREAASADHQPGEQPHTQTRDAQAEEAVRIDWVR